MYENTLSAADVAAVTRNNDGNGMFGNGNDAWWIIVLLLFGWGRNGFGGFGGFGGGFGGGCGSPCATQADLAAGFNNSAVLANLNDLALGQANIQQTLCQGFSGVNTAIMQNGYNTQGAINGLSHQLAECLKKISYKFKKAVGTCAA